LSTPDNRLRELVALTGPVHSEQRAGAVNLVLRGHAADGDTEVLFSAASAVALPPALHDVRVVELLDAASATERHFRLQAPQLLLELRARSVQLHRDAAAAFFRALPPTQVPLRLRLGWSLLLSLLRLPGADTLLRKLRGST
jgi:hypothetical protein